MPAKCVGGPKNWSSGFLPASYQGTLFRREGAPILDLAPPNDHRRTTSSAAGSTCSTRSTATSATAKPEDTELEARLNSYELAYRMQSAAPEAVDLTKRIGSHAQALRHG